MSVKLSYKEIKNQTFVQGLAKLANYGGFKDQRLAYNVAKLIRKWDSEAQMAQDLFMKLVKQYATLDEKGNIKTPEGANSGAFEVVDEKADAFAKARKEFESIEFDIPVHKIRIDQLEGTGLTPMEMMALEPILIEMEAVPSEVATA